MKNETSFNTSVFVLPEKTKTGLSKMPIVLQKTEEAAHLDEIHSGSID